MANVQLFNTVTSRLPATDTRNAHGAVAYALSPKHKLAQLAMTGCMNNTFYANGEAQLVDVLKLTESVDAQFIAKAAVYCRERGHMKDMPALLLAALAAKRSEFMPVVFERVVKNGKMLRNFVQILRSGATGRKSLGTRPKKLVQNWLNTASEYQLLQAAVGNQPSLADIIKMVHPKPNELWREAFFAWVIGKPYKLEDLPEATRTLLRYREDRSIAVPDVPFQLLTNLELTANQWALIAQNMGWQALRMNLNTLARHGALASKSVVKKLAAKLSNAEDVRKAKAYPYQLLAAYKAAGKDIPNELREALQDALDVALSNVPEFDGQIVICPDVSGSMQSPVTGVRQGATTTVRCIDVAALFAAALLRKNRDAKVLPFENKVVNITLNPRDSVLTNAEKLAKIGGGGTSCSAPLAQLVREKAKVDTVIMVSDNESWIDDKRHGATETMRQWAEIKKHNPNARLVCIDLQPYGRTQAKEQADILNVGGFGDAVFDVVAQFCAGSFGAGHWVEAIESTQL